jgi:hypothetical protein
MAAAGDTNLWSVRLLSPRTRRPRWLGENGRLTSDPERALRLRNPELAAQRAQQFLRLHGGDPALLERFALVPAPQAPRCSGVVQPPQAA